MYLKVKVDLAVALGARGIEEPHRFSGKLHQHLPR
jgi:hypothetical protein